MSDVSAHEVLGRLLTSAIADSNRVNGVAFTSVDYDHKSIGVSFDDLIGLITRITKALTQENIAAFVELVRKARELYEQLFTSGSGDTGFKLCSLYAEADALGISLADILKIAELIKQLIALLKR